MTSSTKIVMVFIDPSSKAYYRDRLFQDDPILNRDNCLSPSIELNRSLSEKGIETHTADYLVNRQLGAQCNVYCSFGVINHYEQMAGREDVILGSFYIMEPPVTGPHLYRELNNLARSFNKVYVHNTDGVGYARYFNNKPNLRKLFWSQVQNGIIDRLWANQERSFLMMINSNKRPRSKDRELYSERIRALIALQRLGPIDLYGHGWATPVYRIRQTRHFPYLYWRHRKVLRKIYRGTVESKYETLARYTFAVCFENMIMPGYITEKIFDCFFVGTIPIYLGAPDIEDYVPKDCFIDMRDFGSYRELYAYLRSLSDKAVSSFRGAAGEYLSSEQYQPFTKEKFVEQFEMDLLETLKVNGVDLPKLRAVLGAQHPRGGENE